jgi:hypothetical protein
MNQAFVLGNGQSRRSLNLPSLIVRGPVYGCNALYRDFTPTVLVATDRPISTEIQHTGYARNNRFYTRKPMPDLGALVVPKEYYGFSSGPIATAIAAQDGFQRVYMLGFDMGPSSNGRFNNVYADTEFYKKSIDNPTFTGNWVKQILHVARAFPDTDFIRVFGDTTATIPEFSGQKNMSTLPMLAFLDVINKP